MTVKLFNNNTQLIFLHPKFTATYLSGTENAPFFCFRSRPGIPQSRLQEDVL